jgi:C1A family cysteine protease
MIYNRVQSPFPRNIRIFMRHRSRKYFIVCFLLLFLCAEDGAAQTNRIERLEHLVQKIEANPRAGEVNPAFKRYIERLKSGDEAYYSGENLPHRMGLIPSPQLLPRLNPEENTVLRKAALPTSFDLRPEGVTPVKSQGQCGACWAFATLAALESNLKLSTGETFDFSENHMKNSLLPYEDPCFAGSFMDALAYFSHWKGPVLEADDPYSEEAIDNSPAGLSPVQLITDYVQVAYYVREISRDELKSMIMQYGGVATSMSFQQEGDAYNPDTFAYYYEGDFAEDTNHGVLLVGWMDEFDAENFNNLPAGNGAWIAKNSWGRGWGDNGYFYISYYDNITGFEANSVKRVVPPDTYTHAYAWLDGGTPMSYGDAGASNWVSVTYRAEADEYLTTVGLATFSPNTAFRIWVARNQETGDFLGGEWSDPIETTIARSGYYSVSLQNVSVSRGEIFSVIVEISAEAYEDPELGRVRMPPIPVSYHPGNSEMPSVSPGQSHFSTNGEDWIDFYDESSDDMQMAASIRVYASDTPLADTDSDSEIQDTDTFSDTEEPDTDSDSGTETATEDDTNRNDSESEADSDTESEDSQDTDHDANDNVDTETEGCSCRTPLAAQVQTLYSLLF